MPVTLKGSCHCGAVRYTVESRTPSPYQLCVCSICRKLGGTYGSMDIGADARTLKINGKENIQAYKPIMERGTPNEHIATAERQFCSKCSTVLFFYDSMRPDDIFPWASSIDEPQLVEPEEMSVVHVKSRPNYVRLPEGKKTLFEEGDQPPMGVWHKEHGLYVE